MLTLTVPITERHIERGSAVTPSHRPLALALRSALRASLGSSGKAAKGPAVGSTVTPTKAWVNIGPNGSKQYVATLPPEATEWLTVHRSGRLVKPTTFTLTFTPTV